MGKHFERGNQRRGYNGGDDDQRGNYQRAYRDGGNGARQERKPLVWNDKGRFVSGSILGLITEATLDNGDSRRSFKIGRTVPDRNGGEDKLMPHIGERDIPDYQKVYNDVMRWFAENGSRAD